MGLDRWGCNSYHTVILGLSMTFLVEGVLSKKAPMTGGGVSLSKDYGAF